MDTFSDHSMNRRHFLKGAAGLSAAALAVTIPIESDDDNPIPMGHKARAIIHAANDQANDAMRYAMGWPDPKAKYLTRAEDFWFYDEPRSWYIMTHRAPSFIHVPSPASRG